MQIATRRSSILVAVLFFVIPFMAKAYYVDATGMKVHIYGCELNQIKNGTEVMLHSIILTTPNGNQVGTTSEASNRYDNLVVKINKFGKVVAS